MRKLVTLSLAAVVLAGAGAAYAQAGSAPDRAPLTRAAAEQRSAAMFARMDANRDGVLDRADREARRKAAFDRLDADDSGTFSFEEFSAIREQRLGRGMGARGDRHGPGARRADGNRDGTLTQAEFTQAALGRFDRVDLDKDGTISADERSARRTMHRERHGRNAG